MDKETLSKYGWVVIVIIVLVILMSFAVPFGQYFSDSTMKIVETLKNSTNIERLFVPNGGESGGVQEVITNYTSEQIEADEHLYAIGKTQPEYVVAKFNADYTEVIILANGDSSDGITDDFYNGPDDFDPTYLVESPFTEHSDTLKNVIINKSITSIGVGLFNNCVNISSVDIKEPTASIYMIYPYAFYNCSSIKELNFPDATYMGFAVCSLSNIENLEKISFGNGLYVYQAFIPDTQSLTEIKCSESTFMQEDQAWYDGYHGDDNFENIDVNSVMVYGYGTKRGTTKYEYTAYDFAIKYNLNYIDYSAEPQLTLKHIETSQQSNVENALKNVAESLVIPLVETYGLSYECAFYAALLLDFYTSDEAIVIVENGAEYAKNYINTNHIDELSGGDSNIKNLDDWMMNNFGVPVDNAVNYMETGSWNTIIFAQEYADEIKTDINGLVTNYDVSYYSAVLIWIDREVAYKEFTLAQQSESELESYVNSYYKELFKSESGNDVIDTADEYFKHKLGATANDIAHYIEKGNWPA